MSAPIQIFLHTDSAKRRESWRASLSNSTQICVTDVDQLVPHTPIDVLITDQQTDAASPVKLAPDLTDCENTIPEYDGGLIEVESSPGRGTVFRVRLLAAARVEHELR